MKHDFYTVDGEVDCLRYGEDEIHYGPVCRRCGQGACCACDPAFHEAECPSGQMELF